MPLRRPSPGPSPRLQAMLAQHRSGGGAADVGSGGGASDVGSGGGADASEPSWAWVPRREDLVAPVARTPPGGGERPRPGAGERARSQTGERARPEATVRWQGERGTGRYAGRHREGPPPAASVPGVLRQARYAVPAPAVLAALLVVVLAVAGFGGRVLWAEHTAAVMDAAGAGADSSQASGGGAGDGGSPADANEGGVSGAGVSGVAATGDRAGFGSPTPDGAGAAIPGAGDGAASAGGGIVVHVVGQVRRPGVVRLASGARVEDAIAAAGGATHRADLAGVNLARVLADGEQLRVPAPGEVVAPVPGSVGGGSTSGGTTAGGASAGTSGAPMNLNSASEADLEDLPGIGPVLAGRIVAWRTDHGGFTAVSELVEVSGIGETLLAQLADLVTV